MDKFFWFKEKVYNLIFPIKCGFCNDITQNGSYICDKCREKINIFERENTCKFCGTKLIDKNRICKKCAESKIYYDEFIYFAEYSDTLRSKMLQYKFNDKKYLKDFFAEILTKYLIGVDVEYIIGVPASKKRIKERGYNQTNLIAKRIGDILNITYIPDLLVKTRDTEHQTNFSRAERKNNVKNSFKVADKYSISEKKVLLIDDIFTTGSTVNECSKMLKKSGAKKVIVATILRKNNASS